MPPPLERQCKATSKHTGLRCGQWAVFGTTVCHYHGGKAPQVLQAARERILEAAHPAISELIRIAHEGEDDDVRLRAVKDILDRGGLAVKVTPPDPTPSITVNVQQIILEALAEFPDAKPLVARKLLELEHAQSQPKTNSHAADVVDLKPEGE